MIFAVREGVNLSGHTGYMHYCSSTPAPTHKLLLFSRVFVFSWFRTYALEPRLFPFPDGALLLVCASCAPWFCPDFVFGSVRLGSVWFGSIRYNSGPFDSVSVRYGTVRYGAVRYGAVRCGAVRVLPLGAGGSSAQGVGLWRGRLPAEGAGGRGGRAPRFFVQERLRQEAEEVSA